VKRLKEELVHLKTIFPALIAETQRTAAFGDRSENDEYKNAKSALRRTQRQIWTIEDQLKRVSIIEPGQNAYGIVHLGSVVVLESHGETFTFELVGPMETDPAKGRISHKSPLGAALLGRHKGETVATNNPQGLREYKILEIK
jgi:transcription elongation GreA/GreB family factor